MAKNNYGYIKDNKVYRNAFLEFPDREIGEVKDTEEQAMQYFEDRFRQAVAQVEGVKSKIDATENKGSYLMKVLHLKETLCDFDAIGDFESLYVILNELHVQLQSVIDANRHKNLQIKTALLEQLEAVCQSSEWKSASLSVKEIQGKWVKTGAIAEAHRVDIEDKYKVLVESFYQRRASFYEDLNQMMAQKEEAFKAFLKTVEDKLAKIESSKAMLSEIKNIVEEWKALGRLERSKHNKYWEDLQGVFKKNTQRAKKAEFKANKKSRKEIAEDKEKILLELEEASKSLVPSINLDSLKVRWKQSGRLGKQEDLEINQKFRYLCDMISEKRFLDQLVSKKSKRTLNEEEKNKLRLRLMYDLLKRDQSELNTFEENMGKFNTSSGLNEMLLTKLEYQKRKVGIKKEIIDELKRLK